MSATFIVDAVRTPVGRFRGALKDVRADDLAALPLRALLERTGLEAARVDEVILGCANQAGEDNRNVARMALLLAGFPHEVSAVTVNRLCGSGMEAVVQGARMIALGEAEVVIAGGVESMTRAPWAMPKPADGFPMGKLEAYDTSLGWRFPNPKLEALFPLEAMGETAENICDRFGLKREELDAFALGSHQKAVAAQAARRFDDELIAVEVPQKKGPSLRVTEDEGPRADTTLEKLSKLAPAFRKGGMVTAGNSSTLNDGAAAVLLMSERAMKTLGREPLARVVSGRSAGVDPRVMGLGPIPATRKVLAATGWQADQLDLIEINEAFAAQVIANLRELALNPEKVNVNGGGIALGHPLGMSGARLVTTLAHGMKRQGARKGLATMCVGVGQGIAIALER